MSEQKVITGTGTNNKEQELVIERIFDAPRELVWKAWTEPERVMRWWGTADFTSPVCKIDLRVGGKYVFCMRSPAGWPEGSADGMDIWSTGVYREIVPVERLVFTDCFADADGNVVPGSTYGMGDDFPLELLIELTFDDLGGKTRMTLRHFGWPAGEMKDMMPAGWNESFDTLAESLK
jgi:uncharacterized protein YndB with AHSA1/START domain